MELVVVPHHLPLMDMHNAAAHHRFGKHLLVPSDVNVDNSRRPSGELEVLVKGNYLAGVKAELALREPDSVDATVRGREGLLDSAPALIIGQRPSSSVDKHRVEQVSRIFGAPLVSSAKMRPMASWMLIPTDDLHTLRPLSVVWDAVALDQLFVCLRHLGYVLHTHGRMGEWPHSKLPHV